jgi:hypothetical protein
MTIVRLCDFCGREIRRGASRIKLMESDAREYPRSVIGDYHDYCWLEVREALRLIEGVGGSLHNLRVATHQAISAMRRRHHLPDGRGAA